MLLAGLSLSLASVIASAQDPGPKYRVSVEAPTREIRDLLRRGLQLTRWQDDPQMSAELLRRLSDEALAEAREALAALGYYSAQVSYSIDRERTPWSVVLRVEPGARTTVGHVELSFTGPAAIDPEAVDLLHDVRRDWLLRAGMPFTQADWNDAKREAVRKLSSWRYAAARIASSHARVDPEARVATLEVTLESGPAYQFGALEVRGTKRYPEAVVADQSSIKPGAIYEREVLALYTRRLLATGYFAGARVELIPEEAREGGMAPVRASVIEGSSQNIEGGISFNTDAGLRLEAAHRNVDLFGTAWRGKSQLKLDQLTQELRYDLDSPPRPGARWWTGFASAKHSDIQQEENTNFSFGVAHNWAGAGSPTAVEASLNSEEQRISGGVPDHREALYLGARIGFRDTDEIVLPRRGYFGLATAGGAPEGVATQPFLRATGRITALLPLGRNDDLQFRAEGGIVSARSREGIPSTFLFRTGGDQTIRGYAFESLGERRGDAVLGGRYLAIASVEYTHWFAQAWGLAAFVDGGDAWDDGPFNPVAGIGGGLRLRTPIGPVRVDLAYGEQEQSWRLHFSVGFVF